MYNEKRKLKKFIDALMYIIFTIALWVVCYTQRFDFEKIRIIYFCSFGILFISALILYTDSPFELILEFFKSTTILILTSSIPVYLEYKKLFSDCVNGIIENEQLFSFMQENIYKACHWGVALVGNQALVLGMVILIKSQEKLFGKYNKLANSIMLLVVFSSILISNLNYIFMFLSMIFTIIYLYKYHKKHKLEVLIEKNEEAHKEKLRQQKQEEFQNCIKMNEELKVKNSKLLEENLRFKYVKNIEKKKIDKEKKYGRKKRKK